MKTSRAAEFLRTIGSMVSLAQLLLPVLAGVLAPVLFAGGIFAALAGVLAGAVLTFALSASGAPVRARAWWESYKRGYTIESVTAVLDMSSESSPRSYVEKALTTIRFKRNSPGIVVESHEWSGHGQLGELAVTGGQIIGAAQRRGRTVQAIDLLRDFDAGDEHTYSFEQPYLDIHGDFEHFLAHELDSAARELRMLVQFAQGETPSEEAVRVRGRGGRLEYDRAANAIALRVERPRTGETYRLEWEPVAPRRTATTVAGGEGTSRPPAVLPKLLAMRYDCTARQRWR